MSARSTDGTHEFLTDLAQSNKNLIYYSHGQYWKSKDEQVNHAIKYIKYLTNSCNLWQVDADEQWLLCDIINAEKDLAKTDYVAAGFKFNHFLGKNIFGELLIGKGEWGSNYNIRLWKWNGEEFLTHEPPVIKGQRGFAKLTQTYNHYSYYFEQDVLFKSMYYRGYESVMANWKKLLNYTGKFPIPAKQLLGNRLFYSKNSIIDKFNP